MSTLRSARPLIGKGCLLLQSRKFHAAPPIKARPVSKQSPRARAANSPAGSARVKRTYGHEESLPPIALLEAARKSGALTVKPDEALHFLREYQALAGKSNTGWEQRLCNGEPRQNDSQSVFSPNFRTQYIALDSSSACWNSQEMQECRAASFGQKCNAGRIEARR